MAEESSRLISTALISSSLKPVIMNFEVGVTGSFILQLCEGIDPALAAATKDVCKDINADYALGRFEQLFAPNQGQWR